MITIVAVNLLLLLMFDSVIINTVHASLDPCLYPHESETREVKSLDGIWNFVRGSELDPDQGVRDGWFADDLKSLSAPGRRSSVDISPIILRMPVPSSYNDITTDRALRDHVGTVWYDRQFFVPPSWFAGGKQVWLRFGSVHYAATVWVNGQLVTAHQIGHLPFQADVSGALHSDGSANRVTVLCDNRLWPTTVPQGNVTVEANDNDSTIIQEYTFDFFNYAGIHRSVHLYTTPALHIRSVIVSTNVQEDGTTGRIQYNVSTSDVFPSSDVFVQIRVLDAFGTLVVSSVPERLLAGEVSVPKANLWWPYLMHPDPGYLYTLELRLVNGMNNAVDVYRLRIGIRSLRWTSHQFLINEKPLYLRGFGKHEDSDIRGKGLDLAVLTRDFNLLRWVGANAYRTSHYPYSEESMQFADEAGIMIIDECPGVNTDDLTDELLLNHKSAMEQLIVRDRNHASVIAWSISNEARSSKNGSDAYFAQLAALVRSLDSRRPVTSASDQDPHTDQAARHLDIIGVNKYNGWYQNTGRLDMIAGELVRQLETWHELYGKPVILFEYGADTIAGQHSLPSVVWTEDYQRELFSQHFRAFDVLRSKGFFIGEFLWNFADFMTKQGVGRVVGNKKGLFTRQREPKAAAWMLRKRYYALARADANDMCLLPTDLYEYVFVEH